MFVVFSISVEQIGAMLFVRGKECGSGAGNLDLPVGVTAKKSLPECVGADASGFVGSLTEQQALNIEEAPKKTTQDATVLCHWNMGPDLWVGLGVPG